MLFLIIKGSDNSPTSKLNFTQLTNESGIDRNVSEKIVSTFISLVGNSIQTGRQALLVSFIEWFILN